MTADHERESATVMILAHPIDCEQTCHSGGQIGRGGVRIAGNTVATAAAVPWHLWRINAEQPDALVATPDGVAIGHGAVRCASA